MSKVTILWFNFSSSTSYVHLWFDFSSSTSHLHGPVSSSLSLYTSDLVNKDIGHQHSICTCGDLRKRSINVTNRRNTYLDIKDIRTHDGRSAVNDTDSRLLKIEVFYQLLKQTIKEHYNQTFDFEGHNMAVFIDEGERFDVLKILESFKVKLTGFYQFSAPIDMAQIDAIADEQEADAMADEHTWTRFSDHIHSKDDGNINEFVQWVSSVCPSLQ